MTTLQLAYWFSTHKAVLRKFAYAIGIAVVSIIWLLLFIRIVTMVRLLRATQYAYETIGQTSVTFDALERPQALQVVRSGLVSASSQSYDAYALVKNPNHFYGGSFSYTFTALGKTLSFTEGVIMPDEELWLIAQDIAATPGEAQLTLGETQWQRVKGQRPQVDFSVNNPLLQVIEAGNPTATTEEDSVESDEIVTPDETTTSDTVTEPTTTTITSFSGEIVNNSAYGFRRATVTVVVQDEAELIIGVHRQVLSDILSFSSQPLQVSWFRRFPFGSEATTAISVDYLDTANLILPGDE